MCDAVIIPDYDIFYVSGDPFAVPYPDNITPGTYVLSELLRKHSNCQEAIEFIADMVEE